MVDTSCPTGTKLVVSDRSKEDWSKEPCVLGIGEIFSYGDVRRAPFRTTYCLHVEHPAHANTGGVHASLQERLLYLNIMS